MPILYIRDESGDFIPINAIKGANGKSAYEQAQEGGYTGTEEEFVAVLNGLTQSEAGNHYSNFDNPHQVTAGQVGALPLSGGTMKNAIWFNNGLSHIVGQPDGNFVIRTFKSEEDGNDDIFAFHNKLELPNILRVYRNGVPYSLYGQHNKPSATDVGAVSSTIGESDKTLKIDIGNHNYIHSKYDSEVPEMSVISNFTHYITLTAEGKVEAVLSIPVDYTNKAFYYTCQDKVWHEIADEKPLRMTYQGNGESAERQMQVGGKGHLVIIASEKAVVFLSVKGGRYWVMSSTTAGTLASDKATFADGVLTLKTNSSYVNSSGVTYYVTAF